MSMTRFARASRLALVALAAGAMAVALWLAMFAPAPAYAADSPKPGDHYTQYAKDWKAVSCPAGPEGFTGQNGTWDGVDENAGWKGKFLAQASWIPVTVVGNGDAIVVLDPLNASGTAREHALTYASGSIVWDGLGGFYGGDDAFALADDTLVGGYSEGVIPTPCPEGKQITSLELRVDAVDSEGYATKVTLHPVYAAATQQQMYRLYNPNSGEHFYTADVVEKNRLVSVGWDYEGIGWTAAYSSSIPVYRMYNSNPSPKTGSGEHHYTTSAAERDSLVAAGWENEGIGWYSDDAQVVPLYRVYNPNEFNNNHHYTTSAAERDHLLSLGWRDEGIAWYGV